MRSYHLINHSNKWYLVPVTDCYCCCHCQLIQHRNCTLILRILGQCMHCTIFAVTLILMIQQSSGEADRWRQKNIVSKESTEQMHSLSPHSSILFVSEHSQKSYIFLTSSYMPWLPDVQSSSLCNRGTTDHRPEITMSSVHFRKRIFQDRCQGVCHKLAQT
jgi:hypothetical protein